MNELDFFKGNTEGLGGFSDPDRVINCNIDGEDYAIRSGMYFFFSPFQVNGKITAIRENTIEFTLDGERHTHNCTYEEANEHFKMFIPCEDHADFVVNGGGSC